MLRLTNKGKIMVAVMVVLYLASMTSQSGLLLVLIGILTGCVGVNAVLAGRTVRRLAVHAPPTAQLSEGEHLSQPWRIANLSARPAGLMEVSSGGGVLFRIASLAPGDVASVVPALAFQRRGVFPYGQVRVASVFPFGLVESSRLLKLEGEVTVYPAVYPVTAPQAAGYDVLVGGKHHGTRRSTSGSQFAGVRPLQPGDPLKQIHWKSSSKGRGLMVKTYDEELSGRVGIIVDSGHKGNGPALDNCLRAAGSLMFAALDEGHHVEWLDLHLLEAQLVPPFDDGHEILMALARMEGFAGCVTAERLRRAVKAVSHKSALCFVLTAFNAEVAELAAELVQHRRVVTLCLPAGTACEGLAEGVAVRFYEARRLEETEAPR